MYFDYYGDEDGLGKWDEAYKKACDETDGIKYKGRYTSHQARYHWVYFFEAEAYGKVMEAMQKIKLVRDRKLMSHASLEIFGGPHHK